jgi:acetyl-CoA carboxylase carboxyltransferase component
MGLKDKLKRFKEENKEWEMNKDKIKAQHDKGKMTAWERLDFIFIHLQFFIFFFESF